MEKNGGTLLIEWADSLAQKYKKSNNLNIAIIFLEIAHEYKREPNRTKLIKRLRSTDLDMINSVDAAAVIEDMQVAAADGKLAEPEVKALKNLINLFCRELLQDFFSGNQSLTTFLLSISKTTNNFDISATSNYGFINKRREGGQVDHYNHYFGSVVLPLIDVKDTYQINKSVVYFMHGNGLFDEETLKLAEDLGIKLIIIDFQLFGVQPFGVLNEKVETVSLPGYDFYWTGDSTARIPSEYERIKKRVRSHFGLDSKLGGRTNWLQSLLGIERKQKTQKVILIGRRQSQDYYKTLGRKSGADRRSVANIEDIITELATEFSDFNYVEFEDLALNEKAVLCDSADVIILQHGAGLMSSVFMRPGASLIEILPENIGYPLRNAGREIAALNEMWYFSVSQQSPKSSINIAMLKRAVSEALNVE